jgi:hypothetical protein
VKGNPLDHGPGTPLQTDRTNKLYEVFGNKFVNGLLVDVVVVVRVSDPFGTPEVEGIATYSQLLTKFCGFSQENDALFCNKLE